MPGAHDLARGLHFRTQNRVGLGKFDEWEYRFFDREIGRNALLDVALHRQRLAGHDSGRHFGELYAGRLGNEGHGSRGTRIDLEKINSPALNRELNVHQSDHVQGFGEFAGLRTQLILDLLGQRVRRQRTARIPGMDPRLFYMLHDAADQHVLPVADRIDVDLDREIEKTIQQHRTVVRYLDRVEHVLAQVVFVEDDFHGAAAEHVTRAHDQRKTDVARQQHGLFLGARRRVGRLLELQGRHQFLEALAVFGDIDAIGCGADNRSARGGNCTRELQRRLAAELHDHALGLFFLDDLHDVFERQRFEIQAIGGVVVGRHGFRIAVDHDRLEAVLAQCHGGMHAAIIEFYTLTYSIRSSS